MLNGQRQNTAEPPLLRLPHPDTMLRGWDRCARWLQRTYGGPRLTLSAHARRVLESHCGLGCARAALAQVVADEGPKYAVANLLRSIAELGRRLRDHGRQALDLPAEARDLLLQFVWGRQVDRATVQRAVEAAQELDTKLRWKVLAIPLAYPGRNMRMRGPFERDDD